MRKIFGIIVSAALFWAPASLAAEINGFGTDIPLSFALRQIVPSHFEITFAPGVDADRKTTWRARGEWRGVLQRVAAENGLRAEITSSTVQISALETSVPVAAAPATAGDGGGFTLVPYRKTAAALPEASAEKATAAPVSLAAPVASEPLKSTQPSSIEVVKVPGSTGAPLKLAPGEGTLKAPASMAPIPSDGEVVKSVLSEKSGDTKPADTKVSDTIPGSSPNHLQWTAASGGDLQDTLYEWAKRGGWSLVWKSDYQYPIEAPATFEGDFMTASTALFRSIRANPPLYPTFFKGNQVVVVSNAKDDTR